MDNKEEKILQQKNFKISQWSGGVTKQLYIYPQDGDYPTRNFKFRISIATTQLQQSVFTKLENVDRVISIIEGQMELEHQGHYSKVLRPYDIERFKGDWETNAKGKVVDFNLMLKNCRGDFVFKQIKEQERLKIENSNGLHFIYCINGQIQLKQGLLKIGQLLITNQKQIVVSGLNEAKIFFGYADV